MIAIFGTITALYVIIISILCFAYKKIKTFKPSYENLTSRFSILVPFRNEAKNLEGLLNSIEALEYPKSLFEVIFVDPFRIKLQSNFFSSCNRSTKAQSKEL